MKTCPHCNLHFNDGYLCPQCGGMLYDQDPYAQPAQPFGYAPQQPYAPQPAAYQPTQAYAAPEAVYREPAPEPAPLPVTTAPLVASAPPAKSSRGKTVAIVILTILALALGAACAYLFLTNPPHEGPTELERTVVDSAWTWQTNVSDLLDEMDAAAVAFANAPESAAADAEEPAANAKGTTNGTAANAEPTEAPSNGTPSAADTAASNPAAEEPAAQAASTNTETLTDDEAAALAEAEALVAAAEANAAERHAGTAETTADQERMGASAGKLLGYMVALATLASDEQTNALDAPMQALSADYPELVAAWNNVRDTVTAYLQEHLNEQDAANEGTAPVTSENAGTPAANANAEGAANTADATNAEDANASNAAAANTATTDAANTTNAAGANTATASTASAEASAWEQFLDAFRAAREDFLQKANDAGFALS